MNILVVTFYFPPFGGGAVVRVHAFVKYLSEDGISSVVLTAKSDNYEDYYYDGTLIDQYSNNVQIFRARMIFGKIINQTKRKASLICLQGYVDNQKKIKKIKKYLKSLLIPDDQILWVPGAIRMGIKIIKNQKIDAILATAPPFSSHLVGAYLSQKFCIPLILDYRDLWTENKFYQNGNFNQWLLKKMEYYSVKTAKKLVVTTENARASQISRFNLPESKVFVIENGFDEEFVQTQGTNEKNFESETFKIRYIGSLTPNRTPEYFFTAFEKFHNLHKNIKMVVDFIGYSAPIHIINVASLPIKSMINFHGSVSRSEAFEFMKNSHLLLLFQRDTEGGMTAIPGKIYEYLSSGIPILTMDEGKGATSTLIRNLNGGYICEYEDVNAILYSLEVIILNYQEALNNSHLLLDKIGQYSRRSQTAVLAKLIQEIVTK